MSDIQIRLVKAAACGSLPRFRAEYRGVRWEFGSRNCRGSDALKNEAMRALADTAITAGRGADANPRRYESGHDYIELMD
jgi:hypothetical protein